MEKDTPLSVQDIFFNHACKNKTPINVFLVNSIKLQGIIKAFDDSSILLTRDGQFNLIYKHSISTVMSQASSQSFESSRDQHND